VDARRFPELIAALYDVVAELERMFPGRHFTPDGHLVGSIGEALASHYYGIELATASAEGHDGHCGGKAVQIKATQGDRIALSSEPEHLLVLKLSKNGSFVEEYNGPGAPAWQLVSHKARPKNGQYQIALSKLRRLSRVQDSTSRLPRRTAA
jgi:hypothetical protein